MASTADNITERLHTEIDHVPTDRRATLLTIVHAYCEAAVNEIDPAESIRCGLADIRAAYTPSKTYGRDWTGLMRVEYSTEFRKNPVKRSRRFRPLRADVAPLIDAHMSRQRSLPQ